MGPEGGDGGGTVVATGTPEQLAAHPGSHTGRFLAEVLGRVPVEDPDDAPEDAPEDRELLPRA
jgi:excinuclease ABC subunit A